ncbi:hypothetical protein FJ970_02775 [Mesorhizobium sp. B2-1-8]|uniref:hypothetical protein n=1 Tax=Mesorhizobium sp. B2-1-8 TaxID=2589967 RepID=UPI0011287938|nr:hypothetical protein [Mesorhizobium sp. B2-1-8]UCI19913.1 hypothetical protein FJ970_02775 [Mesorhizobium sp. B2-1-8]
MSAAGLVHHQLREKLLMIAEEKLGLSRKSLRHLALAMEVHPSTLTKAVKKEQLTWQLETKITAYANLDPKNPYWRDSTVSNSERAASSGNYKGRDSIPAFRRYFLARQGRDEAVPRKINCPAAVHRNTNLATFVVQGPDLQLIPPDRPIELSCKVVMKQAPHLSYRYGFSVARLRLKVAGATLAKFKNLFGEDNQVAVRDALVTGWGAPDDPEIIFKAKGKILEGEYLTSPACSLDGVAPGETVRADLAVAQCDAVILDRNGDDMDDAARAAVLGALQAMLIKLDEDFSNDSDDGWIILGVQKLTVVGSDLS